MTLINISQYMTLSLLAKGNNPVLKVQSLETQEMFALKKITRDSLEHHVSDLQEILLLSSINHPNIIRIKGFETKQVLQNKVPKFILYILMELMKKNLEEEINERRNKLRYFSREEMNKMVSEMLESLEFLHGKGIAHRDLKPENILLGDENQIILTDFNDSYKRNELRPFPKTIVGSPYYMSPELRSLFIENEELNENNYDAFKSDVYSLGVTFVDLATSTIGESKPLKEKLDFIKKRYGSKFSDFLTEMLVEDFKQRKSIKELKQLFKENMILQKEEMIKSDEVYNVENLKNLELTKEVFEYFQNIPMPNELKQNLILNLQKLCELEQENKRLKKMTEIAKRESKDQIEKKVETKSKESDIIEWGFKKENKGSLFKTIAAIFCSPS